MSPLLLLLLPAAAPANRHHSETDKSLQAWWTPPPPAKAPLLIFKQSRTGSGWVGVHFKRLGIFSEVRMDTNIEPVSRAVSQFGVQWERNVSAYSAYCKYASDAMVQLFKGWDGKYGAGTLNPFENDLEYMVGNVQWKCMTQIEEAITKAVWGTKDFPSPNIVVLTRDNVVQQAISNAKAIDMENKGACDRPYAEGPAHCIERFKYRWNQDAKQLLDLAYLTEAEAYAMVSLAKTLKRSWGSPDPVTFTLEDMLKQGGNKGLALPDSIADMHGMQHEGPFTVDHDPTEADSSSLEPNEEMLNFAEIEAYFKQHAPERYLQQLRNPGTGSSDLSWVASWVG